MFRASGAQVAFSCRQPWGLEVYLQHLHPHRTDHFISDAECGQSITDESGFLLFGLAMEQSSMGVEHLQLGYLNAHLFLLSIILEVARNCFSLLDYDLEAVNERSFCFCGRLCCRRVHDCQLQAFARLPNHCDHRWRLLDICVFSLGYTGRHSSISNLSNC